MNLHGLQLFAEAVAGKRIVYLYRIAKDAATKAAWQIAFATENGRTKAKMPMPLPQRTAASGRLELLRQRLQQLLFCQKVIRTSTRWKDAMDSDELIEIWEANLDEPASTGQNKFKGMYFQGYITEFEKTTNAEDNAEISLTFGINGSGARGEVTVTAEQQEQAAYVFTDTTVQTED